MTGRSAQYYWLLFIFAAMGFTCAMAQRAKGPERNNPAPAPYPIASEVFTTRERTVVPEPPTPIETIFPSDISKYAANGYGKWHYGPGIGSSLSPESGLIVFPSITSRYQRNSLYCPPCTASPRAMPKSKGFFSCSALMVWMAASST